MPLFHQYPVYEQRFAQVQLICFMLAMGASLSLADCVAVFRRPRSFVSGIGVQLVVLPSPYRELTRPLLRYVNRLGRRNGKNGNDIVTVVLPEFVPAKWWQHLLHNQSSLMLKGALLFTENVIVISVPYHLKG